MLEIKRSVMRFLAVMGLLLTSMCDPALAGTMLTLHDCIENALANHPDIRAAQESLNAGQGRVTQAASPYLPQVTASTGYSDSHALGGAFGETITKTYTTTLSVNQVLYDFGKTGNALDAARFGTQSAEKDIDRVVQEVVLNVKQAYYALLQAKKLVNVAQQSLMQTESHLKQAEAFFRAGSKPRYDVTRAEVDVNSAKLGLIHAENTVRLNTISLYNAMGLDPIRDVEIEDVLSQPTALPSLDEAQAAALKNRPEMQKAEFDIQQAQSHIKSEQSNYLPTLSANGAYNWTHGNVQAGSFEGIPLVGEIQDSWNAGVMLSMPLFEGGLTNGRVSEARANKHSIEAQRDKLRQSILLEVNQAYADLESAAARIAVMDSSLKSAQESLELAEGRYREGVGPSIEVTDARVADVKAETDYVQALYDYQLAAAKLAKAMGKGLER
ncbi:MAG TPA: TolC family protein [Nitrospirota bacterium]|nr:TolC family protein [Nitrospirota bacterium]